MRTMMQRWQPPSFSAADVTAGFALAFNAYPLAGADADAPAAVGSRGSPHKATGVERFYCGRLPEFIHRS